MNELKFNWGHGVTDTTPTITPGQILLDKDNNTLHIDTDDNQRLQISDPTKMDKFGEYRTIHAEVEGGLTSDYNQINFSTGNTTYLSLTDYLQNVQSPDDNQDVPSCSLSLISNRMDIENRKLRSGGILAEIIDNSNSTYDYEAVHNRIQFSGYRLSLEFGSINLNTGENIYTQNEIWFDDGGIELRIDPDNEFGGYVRGITKVQDDSDATNKQYVDNAVTNAKMTWGEYIVA